MLRSFALLLCLQAIGEAVAMATRAPVPGRIIGMLLLLVLLLRSPAIAAEVEPTAKALLANLSLLFVPAGVGVMVYAERLHGEGLAIAVALIASAVSGILVTAWIAQLLMRARRAPRDVALQQEGT